MTSIAPDPVTQMRIDSAWTEALEMRAQRDSWREMALAALDVAADLQARLDSARASVAALREANRPAQRVAA